MTTQQVGQLASRDQRFCPYAAVNKWPYKHLHGEVSRVVSDNFFAGGAFRERTWTIYYIRMLLDSTEKPLLLIPESEVQQLFSEISNELNIQVTFPHVTKEPGFQLSFQEDGSPRPRYLGRLTMDYSIAELEESIPRPGAASEEPEELNECSFPMFRHHMQQALLASKQKTKAVRDKKRQDRIGVKRARCEELKRTQCYLGLRRRGTAALEEFISEPNMSYEETLKAEEAYEIAAGITIPPLDISVAAPYSFDRNAVFVCVDIEVYERDSSKMTEIGVVTLDTMDVIRVPPGEGGGVWMKHLRCRHFRIIENGHLNNEEFVSGCADRYEFGISEWISIHEAPQVLASCFKAPFSEPGKYTPYPADSCRVPRGGSKIPPLVKDDPSLKRNIILVGHSIGSDIDYMRTIGYDVGNLPNVIEAIDTTNLFRAFKHEQNPKNLGAVLLELGLTGWFLHNAGNDATYTMQALLRISIAALSPTRTKSTEPAPDAIEEAASAAKERIKEEFNEWQMADEEGGDGGEPVALLPAAQAQSQAAFDRALRHGQKADERREVQRAREREGRRGGGRVEGGRARGYGERGGGRGERERGRGRGEGPVASEPMGLDEDALDAAMGFAPPPAPKTYVAPSARSVSQTPPAAYNAPYERKGYVPPHLRKAKEQTVAADGPEKEDEAPPVSAKMAAKLKLLDSG